MAADLPALSSHTLPASRAASTTPGAWTAQLAGIALIAAAALGAGVFTWFVSSLFIPLAYTNRPVEYIFVGAPASPALAVACAVVLIATVVHRLFVPAGSDSRWSWRSLDYLTPVALLGCAPLGGAVLLAGGDVRLAPLTYVLVDLRWWWASALLATAVTRFDNRRGQVWRAAVRRSVQRLRPASRLALLDGTLFALLCATAIVSSPILRFTSELHGDEPKYLRLAENWYQGWGLDVGQQRQMADLTLTFAPRLEQNGVRFVQAVRQDAGYLAADARTFLSHGLAFKYNRAQFIEGWFVTGRNGGFYQVHNPGLSLLLAPAYFFDRHFIATSAGYQGVFPTTLPVTNLWLLMVWCVWGVVLFRFLRAALSRDGLAWLLAATALLTMPASAFPFQIYPETTAGVIITTVCGWLLFARPDETRARAAILAGAAVGVLPWLHVRFLVTSLVLAGYGLVMLRRRRLPYAVAYGIVTFGLCLFAYHITGSLRPDAMYEAEGSAAPWRLQDALQSMLSYPFDRIWGFLPHAPVFLFAIPGWTVLARAQRRTAVLLALLIASLVLAASGHGFTGAGATPLRFLVAVVPLAMVPVGWSLITWGRSPLVRAAFLVLLVLSVDSALSYNTYHRKEVGRLMDHATSGWAPNLLFPWTHGEPWATWPGTFVLLSGWALAITALLLLPMIIRRRWTMAGPDETAPAAPLSLPLLASTIALFLAIATAATGLGGEWTRLDYWPPLQEARLAVLRAGRGLSRCPACYSSFRGIVGPANLVEDTAHTFTFSPLIDDVRVGEEAAVAVAAAAEDGPGAGSLAIDYGDGATTRVDVLGRAEVRHVYSTPGLHRVSARFGAHGAPAQYRSVDVAVRPGHIDMSLVEGLADGVSSLPMHGTIDRVLLGEVGIHTGLADGTAASASWLLVWEGQRWHAYPAEHASTLRPGWVVVVAIDAAGRSRTEPVTVRWPNPSLVAGAPVVLYP